jgi:hypothetical protein
MKKEKAGAFFLDFHFFAHILRTDPSPVHGGGIFSKREIDIFQGGG